MVKKVYHISGFDCANCAAKAEKHLNNQSNIELARLDFAGNRLYITFKKEVLSVEELAKVIAQVESDPLDIHEIGNKSKTYHISGFDCANCASKTECYLNKHEEIESARLDFSGNKLHIAYKNKPFSVDELKSVIKEVESDPLEIYELEGNKKQKAKAKIFTKNMWIILIRTILATIITLVCVFLLGKEQYNWLRYGLYVATFLMLAYDIIWKVILHIIHRSSLFDHNLLITVAGIGAFTLGAIQLSNPTQYHIIHELGNNYSIAMDDAMEAVMVVIFFQVGRIIEAVATNKSKASVMSAVELRVDTANLITEEGIKTVSPEELEINQKILVKVGELIPVDGEVIDGDALVDTSSLTGEFVPVQVKKGESVYSGCLIKQGNITVLVKKVYADSTVSKIIELITSGGEKKSKADEFIAKFSRFYTPTVVGISALYILIAGLISQNWMSSVYQGLEILVTGCPCAIVISVPLAYFAAIGLSSKHGIVVKGANYLDKLVDMGILITDKTGTLTKGTFSIQKIVPAEGIDEDVLLDALYKIESLSTHPIGKAICHGKNLKRIASEITNYEEIAGYGVVGDYKNQHIIAGSAKLMNRDNISFVQSNDVGTVIYVAVNNQYYGYVVLSDEIKEGAKEMVDLLHKNKVDVVLLTGDHEENAKDLSNKLGIDRYHSELLPEQKTVLLEQEMSNTKRSVAFIGDGINDAPSIIRSDIGIAMGGIGSDIAVENADIVIMNDNPVRVYDALKIAHMARNTAIFNIVFSLVLKASVAILVALQPIIQNYNPNFVIPMYVAVIADTGLTVVMVLNALLLLYRKVKR